jgi:tetratricopeptide (TPR) repeat protein
MNPFHKYLIPILFLLLIHTGCNNLTKPSQFTPDEPNLGDIQLRQAELIEQYMDALTDWDYAAAQEAIDELRELPLDIDITYDFSQAFLDLRLGRYDDALELVERMEPDIYTSDLLQLRAEIYMKMHRLDEARSDLLNFLEARPGDRAYIYFLLREIALAEGDVEKAGELENLLFDNYPIHRYSLFTEFYKAIRERDFRSADEVLERLSTSRMLDETGQDETDYYSIYILFGRADLAYRQGQYDRAVEIYKGISELRPLAASVWQILAMLGLVYGNIADARQWSIEGIVRSGGAEILGEIGIEIPLDLQDPDPDPGPLRNDNVGVLLTYLGQISLMGGAFDRALACAECAIEVNPYATGAYSLKSRALEMMDDPAGAVDALIAGLRLNPSSDVLVCGYARLYEDARYVLPPTAPDPALLLENILVVNRNLYEAWPMNAEDACNLALVLDASGEESGCDLFREAHEIMPERFDYASSYAWCLADYGDSDGAILILENFEIPLDLPWLIGLYGHAEDETNQGSFKLADWVRGQVDPYGVYDELLDPHADAARNAVDAVY